jgi:hypothetical protein
MTNGGNVTGPFDKREWLASQTPPLAIAGARGKFSAAAHAALKAAEASGITFLEKGAPTTTVTRMVDGEEVTETKTVDPYAPHSEPIRTGRLKFALNGKVIDVNSAEACATCKHSFGWCYCDVPTFHYWRDSKVYSLA